MTEVEMKALADLMKQTVSTEIAGVKQEIDQKFADQEKAAPKYAALHGGAPAGHVKSEGDAGLPKDVIAGRFLKASIRANGDIEKAKWYMDNDYKSFPAANQVKSMFDMQLKTGQNITTPSEGGFLVNQMYSGFTIDLLLAETAVAKTPVRRIDIPNGNLTIRSMTSLSRPSWSGEQQAGNLGIAKFGNVNLNAKKLNTKFIISNDMLRSQSLDSDSWITRTFQQQHALVIDYSLLYGAGTAYEPKGLDTLIASGNKTGSSSTATTSNTPMELLASLDRNNVPQDGRCWIMHPDMKWYLMNIKATTGQFIYRDELAQNKLIGLPVYVTTQSGYTNTGTYNTSSADIWVGSFPELIWGTQMGLEVVASKDASYYDGTQLVSAFERDETVIRFISLHDFNIMHDVSFAKFTGKFAAS